MPFLRQMTSIALLHAMTQCKGCLFSLRCVGSNAHVPLDWYGTDKSSILQLPQAQEDKKVPVCTSVMFPCLLQVRLILCQHLDVTPVRHLSC